MLKRFESFVTGINICYKSIQRIKSDEIDRFGLGLKGTHVMCVFFLHMNPSGLTSANLAKLCSEDKAAISRTVSVLQEKGFVQTGETRYRNIIRLTPSGEKLAGKLEELIFGWVETIGGGLTDEERDIFYSALGKIADNLNEKTNL